MQDKFHIVKQCVTCSFLTSNVQQWWQPTDFAPFIILIKSCCDEIPPEYIERKELSPVIAVNVTYV